jgi:hypothetical protein
MEAWTSRWRMTFGVPKCGILAIGMDFKELMHKRWRLHGEIIPRVKTYKYLGVVFTNDLSWERAIQSRKSKGMSCLAEIGSFIHNANISYENKMLVIRERLLPTMLWGSVAWADKKSCGLLETILYKAIKQALRISNNSPKYPVFSELGVMPVWLTAYRLKVSAINDWMRDDHGWMSKLVLPEYKMPSGGKSFLRNLTATLKRSGLWCDLEENLKRDALRKILIQKSLEIANEILEKESRRGPCKAKFWKIINLPNDHIKQSRNREEWISTPTKLTWTMAPYLQPGYVTRDELGNKGFKFYNKAAQRAALLLRTNSFALGRTLVKAGYAPNRYASTCLKCNQPHPEGEEIHFLFTCKMNTEINNQFFSNLSVSESVYDEVLTSGCLVGACSPGERVSLSRPGLEWLEVLTNEWRKVLALNLDFDLSSNSHNVSRVKGSQSQHRLHDNG